MPQKSKPAPEGVTPATPPPPPRSDECDNMTIAYMMGAADKSDEIRSKKKRIKQLESVIKALRDHLKNHGSPCVGCQYEEKCEFRYHTYNIGCEPGIDCLAAK